jgi:hypothetical protein
VINWLSIQQEILINTSKNVVKFYCSIIYILATSDALPEGKVSWIFITLPYLFLFTLYR